jgi:hypothetical protein
MSRALVIDTATGVISRTIDGDPALFALQIAAGESLWAIGEDDDGAKVDDAWVVVNGDGELELLGGAPGGVSAPAVTLEFVAEVGV